MSNMDYDPARLGRNWNNQMPECMEGANMMEQKRRAIEGSVVEKLGNIQDQMGHMENHIHFLMNAIDTLESRLHMVLRDEPGRPEKEETVSAMSPLAHALYTFNRRLDKASRNILSLVERLEI